MQNSEIEPGIEYALRVSGSGHIHRVRVLEHIRRSHWRVEWIEPNRGLRDYVRCSDLLYPWKDRRAILKDEANAERLREVNSQQGYTGRNSPVTRAIDEVLLSTGEEIGGADGLIVGLPEAIARVKTRAGLDPAAHSPHAYTNRHGHLHLPFAEALDVARRFAAAEPTTVLAEIDALERDWIQKAEASRGTRMTRVLTDYRAAWALARQWAGGDAYIAQLKARIETLERLVWDAIYALQRAKCDEEAGKLRRKVERGGHR